MFLHGVPLLWDYLLRRHPDAGHVLFFPSPLPLLPTRPMVVSMKTLCSGFGSHWIKAEIQLLSFFVVELVGPSNDGKGIRGVAIPVGRSRKKSRPGNLPS